MLHAALFALLVITGVHPDTALTTEFERSGGVRTGTYDEAVAICRRLADASPLVHFESFGTSGEGRALPVLIVDRDGLRDPAAARRAGRVVVLVQAGIHAGEIDGKDAGLMLVREMTVTKSQRALLARVTLVFVPILNVDGHERSGPYNRPNQNGPESMGFRVNASNLNLNRDYIKADSPEIRAWLSLFNRWQPDLFIDCHVTDGADYQYVMTYLVDDGPIADAAVGAWARTRFVPALETRMRDAGWPLAPYCDFRVWHDPKSGLKGPSGSPRFSTGYVALRNRIGLLVETHMLKDYKTRVAGTRQMLIEALTIANQDGDRLRDAVARADQRVASATFRRAPLEMAWRVDLAESTMIDFLGYDYTIEKSALTGGDWIRFSDRPVTFRIPY